MNNDKMRKKHSHEELGIIVLMEVFGYPRSDIIINSRTGGFRMYKYSDSKGIPDLTTISDGKRWEVKVVDTANRVEFQDSQFKMFKDDDNILIFDISGKFLDCFKFGDIKKGDKVFGNHKNGIYQYRFVVKTILDFHEAGTVFAITDEVTEGIANILTGAPREDVMDCFCRLPYRYIRKIVIDCGLHGDDDYEFLNEQLKEMFANMREMHDANMRGVHDK